MDEDSIGIKILKNNIYGVYEECTRRMMENVYQSPKEIEKVKERIEKYLGDVQKNKEIEKNQEEHLSNECYTPCETCYRMLGRKYSSDYCDKRCHYAREVLQNNKLTKEIKEMKNSLSEIKRCINQLHLDDD